SRQFGPTPNCEPPAPPQTYCNAEPPRQPGFFQHAMPRRRPASMRRMERHMTTKIQRRARARRALPPVYELASYSVVGFCLAHGISRSTFYVLIRAGEGPRIMKCGARTLISVDAAQAWRRARERAAAVLKGRSVGAGHRAPQARRRRR